jgi:trehalose/maltose hydrolase-like predicted phosphorylase
VGAHPSVCRRAINTPFCYKTSTLPLCLLTFLYSQLSADIAFAAKQYFTASGDVAWLKAVGWPLVSGIADFYASRVTTNADGSYSINQVMPPDEYHYPVNDSVYTNVVAASALSFAAEAASLVHAQAGANWTHIASHLRVLVNTTGNYHPEFAGYTGDVVKQADVVMLGFPFLDNMSTEMRVSVNAWLLGQQLQYIDCFAGTVLK